MRIERHKRLFNVQTPKMGIRPPVMTNIRHLGVLLTIFVTNINRLLAYDKLKEIRKWKI